MANSSPPSLARRSSFRSRPSQALGDFLEQHVADAVTERVVDDLEAVEIEKHHGEVVGSLDAVRRAAHLIERGAEHAPVRQPGQRVLRGEPRHVRLRLRALGDVGEGLDEAAVGQMAAAHLDHGPVRHGALADRELLVLGGRRTPGGSPREFARAAGLGVARLVLDQLVEPRRALDELARQIEQFAAAPVDDRESAGPW